MIGQRPPGNESHHHKTRDCEQFSWVPLPYCSRPGCPFPIKSLALSAHVSSRTIHFRVLDKSPVSGPGRGPPSCNKCTMKDLNTFNFCPYLTTVNNLWTSSGADYTLSSTVLNPTPGLLPGKSHGGRSLVGCNPWGR